MAFHRQGRLSDAKKIYEDILERLPDHFDALNLLGVIACQTRDPLRGEVLITKAIKINPNIADAYNNRGNAFRALRRFDAAIADYDKAIALTPDYTAAHNNRGVSLKALKRFDEAVASFDKAIALNAGYSEAHYNRGNALRKLRRLDEAVASYDTAIALRPHYGEAYYNRGNALRELRRFGEAIASFDKAVELKPGLAAAYYNRGSALQEIRRLDEAIASYAKAIALKPDYAVAYNNQGNAFQDLGRLDEALASYDKAIAIRPDYALVYNNRGNALHELKRVDEALASFARAIALEPNYAEVYYNRGSTLRDLERLDEALADFDKAIALKPDADFYNNRGNVLRELGLLDEALACYSKAIALKFDHAMAYNNQGNALRDLKRLDEALDSYDKAIALNPDNVDFYNNRGNVLQELKRLDEALASYDKAIARKSDYPFAYSNRGNALLELKRFDEAISSFDKAIALKPDYGEAHYNRGNVFRDLGRFEEALASYAEAIALKPDDAAAYNSRGLVLKELKRLDEAIASYDMALSLEPDLIGTEGERLHTKMRLCDWTNFDSDCANLTSSVKHGKANVAPLVFVGISSSPEDHLQCAKLWAAKTYASSRKVIWEAKQYRHDRIRIAYVSADFHEHPVSYLIIGMLEAHDKSRFEVTAISLRSAHDSDMRRRVKASVERFIDAETFNDEQIADLVRSSEVDILVDLMGFTAGSRPHAFARRPSPIQVNYLGYPGTIGVQFLDYILADRLIVPDEKRKCYSENVVYLPNSFMATDDKRKISERVPCRSECNLPETGFVFCSFNQSNKIVPRTFDVWMRLLCKIDGSVLWLSDTNEIAIRNLRREAENREVDPGRLIFAERLSRNGDHLARHKLADLFLDTLPYNAHTTANDALWAGLPVLTCLGETFAGRVAASLLNAVGLSELITTTSEAYEQTAIDLASHPEKLAIIKRKLAANRLVAPLFDTRLFTQHVEAAYTAMYKRHQAGLPPDHIVVPS